MNQRIFTDVFGTIITKVKTKWIDLENNPDSIKPVYLFGHYQAIADELAEMATSDDFSDKRLPLVILGIDPDYEENELGDGLYSVSCNVWIVEETKKEFYTSDRFELVYKTVLYPILELIKKEIVDSPMFGAQGVQELGIKTTLHPYWGTESTMRSKEQYINDPLDAIRIKFSGLEVYYDNC